MKKKWLKIFSILVFMYTTQVHAATFPFADLTINNGATIYAGEEFSIDVYARDTEDLFGFAFDMNFDSSWASTGVSVWPGQPLGVDFNVVSSTGAHVAGDYLGIPGLSGDILLATLSFIAADEGTGFIFQLLSDTSAGEGLNEFILGDIDITSNGIGVSVLAARVPEPPVIIMMLIGLLGLVKTTKLRKT